MKDTLAIRQVFQFICKMIKPFKVGILVMFIAGIVWAVDLSLRPYVLKVMLNRIADESRIAPLVGPALLYLLLAFVYTNIFRLYSYFIEIRMIPVLRKRIADISFRNLLEQSHQYYQNHFSGSLSNKMNDLIHSVPELLQIVIDRFFSHALAMGVATYVLWQVNAYFAIAMLSWIASFVFLCLFFSKILIHQADVWSEWGSAITGKIVDTLSNMLSVRLFAQKTSEKALLASTCDSAVKAERKLSWSYFWIFFYYGYSFTLVLALTIYWLIKGYREGWVTIGDFALVLTVNTALVSFLWETAQDFSKFSKLFGKVVQALRALLIKPEVQDRPQAVPLVVKKGEIVFDEVKFRYTDAEVLFQDKSVTILPGQKVGLVGYSGSGKSTFVNLILRLFDVASGRILIDGFDIRDITQDSLHEAIGMIPQDPSLFHRTLKENIQYGRLDASFEEVMAAAQRAYADEFICTLPEGYDSLVGERGVKLSGGQRQRIAIARAILKNAPILILDEATSQLDSVTESEIQVSLWELMKDKTTLVIAHRLSTLLHMDRILVFDSGKIVQDGSHQTLLAEEGLYRTLWNAQVGGFLPEERS